jgi:hypothetical protein
MFHPHFFSVHLQIVSNPQKQSEVSVFAANIHRGIFNAPRANFRRDARQHKSTAA